MATRPVVQNDALPHYHLATWETLTQADADGAGVRLMGNGDRTVQALGTFDSATLAIQGSIDGANWETLQDLEGNALTFAAAGLKGILEAPPFIRPLLSGGTTSDVDVLLSVGKAR
jgi:hypothetical protein